MTIKYFNGSVTAVAQINHHTPANVAETNVFTLTATGNDSTSVDIAYTADADDDIQAVCEALVALWNASTNTLCTGITATEDDTKIILTADNAGTPFTVTSAATGGTATFAYSTNTASAGPNYLGTAANWTPSGVPVTGDTIIFDGQTTESALYDMDMTGVNVVDIITRKSYTGNFGSPDKTGANEGPLIIAVSGRAIMEGSGDYYLQCGNDAADAEIAETILNCTGDVTLSSQKNASGGNVSKFSDVRVVKVSGTLTIAGDADTDETGAESGTYVENLWIAPTQNIKGNATIVIGDQCFDQTGTGDPLNIHMLNGSVTCYSQLGTVYRYGGDLVIGGTAYDMAADDDSIDALCNFDGDVYWHPSSVVSGAEVKASPSPNIALAHMFGGSLIASGMLETNTTGPTIGELNQYTGSDIDLDNGYANFIITTYNKYGGTLKNSQGQALTLA